MDSPHIILAGIAPPLESRVSTLLSSNGYRITSLASWKEASAFALQTRTDLIIGLSDTSPDSGGMEQVLKDDNIQHFIPIVTLTLSGASAEFMAESLRLGAGYHISVPCSEQHFLDRVREIIAGHRRNRAIDEKIRVELISDNVRQQAYVMKTRLISNLLSAYSDGADQRKLLMKCLPAKGVLHDAESNGTPSHPLRDVGGKIEFEDDVIRAIEKREFLLHYQPIVSMTTGRITGFEALIRWKHHERGFISPSEFIHDAEETGLIISLGFFVIEEASRQLAAWHKKFPRERPLTISVNLSTVQFIHPELAEEIQTIVSEFSIPFDTLRFEITESALMADMESANIMLLKLKKMNFKLYMDDFGTGYSSLSYLRHFPMDVLKIDQSFVKWMGIDDESNEIVKTIVHLAHNLKKEVIAEGVETVEHYHLLRELGCEYGQGYYYSKPLDPESAERLLSEDPAW